MEDNQMNNGPRKLRKIKRPRMPEGQPGAFNIPNKVSLPQVSNPNDYQATSFEQEQYFDNNGGAENIQFVTDEMYETQPESITAYLQNKTVLLMLVLSLLVGVFVGSTMFSTKQTTKQGLEGVVINPDVPAGKSRCGLVEPHQGCVLYVMNPNNREVPAKEFYDIAAKWTRRERYLIETGNMHYSSKKIRPGYIAQINIPPL